jgi:Mn2+/Fe2+ NRAMP family transporter
MSKLKKHLADIGPGLIIAATGVGAGDLVTAAVGGANYGATIAWAIGIGALLKFSLNEGIARWQLSTLESVIHAWVNKMPRWIASGFLAYLFLWAFIVAGALMAACGLAAHAMMPTLSVPAWGIVHAIAALLLVLWGKYHHLENLMKCFISLMFITVFASLFLSPIDWSATLHGLLRPGIPTGSWQFILGMIGGVGGSVTLLSYGYWLKEKGWTSPNKLATARVDLGVAYLLTGLFGMVIVILGSSMDTANASGNQLAIHLADTIGSGTGLIGRWIFLLGFWGAVFSSMLGVWSGVPYIYEELILTIKRQKPNHTLVSGSSTLYKGFLVYMAIPPMLLLFLDKPVWVIVIYSVSGAFFMPFLAGTLLYLNNRAKWVKENKNRVVANLLLICTLVLFLYLLGTKVASLL